MAEYNSNDETVDITFCIPCLNEEKNIISTLETIKKTVRALGRSCEIIIIDDHSSDNIGSTVKYYKRKCQDVSIKFIRNKKTMGLGHNYVKGAFSGRGRYYLLVCGDNEEPAEYYIELLNNVGEADMIIPYFPVIRGRNLIRKFISDAFVMIANFLSGNSIKYYNGEVVHLRNNIIKWYTNSNGYGYQAEMITRLIYNKATYIEIPFCAQESETSKAYTVRNILSVLNSLKNILKMRIERK